MKNRLLLIIIVLLVLGVVIFTVCHFKKKNDKIEEPSILIVKKYYNFKSAATFGGTAIFDDGSVYTWYYSSIKREYNSYIGSYSINTKNGLKQFVLESILLII